MGESDFSPRTVGVAKYKTTELQNLQKTLETNTKKVETNLKKEITALKSSINSILEGQGSNMQQKLNGVSTKVTQEEKKLKGIIQKVAQEQQKMNGIATQMAQEQQQLAKIESTTIAAESPFTFPAQRTNSRNKLLTTIPKLSVSYSVEFEFYPTRFQSGWTSVLHLTTGGNCCGYGQRIPGVWFFSSSTAATKNRFLICSAVTKAGASREEIKNAGNKCFETSTTIPRSQWTKVIITQRRDGVGYRYTVTARNVVVGSLVNTKPREFTNVKVYGADPFYNAAQGYMRNLVINANGVATIAGTIPFNFPNQQKLKKNDLWATIPKLSASFTVSFEVNPTSFQGGYTSIIHLTTGGSCCKYGDRMPAVWFRPSSTGAAANSFHICSAVNGQGNYCVDSPKTIRRRQYTKVVITQRREGAQYRYTVKVRNAVIRSVINSQPREWSNVKVYVADPWSPQVNGHLRNLVINPNED